MHKTCHREESGCTEGTLLYGDEKEISHKHLRTEELG
jgi:hypothetical protein